MALPRGQGPPLQSELPPGSNTLLSPFPHLIPLTTHPSVV